jgi:hypothetical protein
VFTPFKCEFDQFLVLDIVDPVGSFTLALNHVLEIPESSDYRFEKCKHKVTADGGTVTELGGSDQNQDFA